MELAAQVKSPRGTTLAGCAVLEQDDALNELFARCLAAAKKRAEELAPRRKMTATINLQNCVPFV